MAPAPSGKRDGERTSARHVYGLDTLRFVAALCVACSHGALPPVKEVLGTATLFRHLAVSMNAMLYNGTAAVMVFFIISGFCIHYPNCHLGRLNFAEHLTRRLVRIGGPLLAALLPAAVVGGRIYHAETAVMWSIYCEIIYYVVYPVIYLIFKRVGVRTVFLGSLVLSAATIIGRWSPESEADIGLASTWLAFLPIWLLGCVLAENYRDGTVARLPGSIWMWRAVALALAAVGFEGHFHGPLAGSFPLISAFFGFYGYFWLSTEILAFARHPPPLFLESAGSWSYSLYLVHPSVLILMPAALAGVPVVAGWAITVCSVLAASYLFYAIVERPSHRLARRLSKRAAGFFPLQLLAG